MCMCSSSISSLTSQNMIESWVESQFNFPCHGAFVPPTSGHDTFQPGLSSLFLFLYQSLSPVVTDVEGHKAIALEVLNFILKILQVMCFGRPQ